MKTNTSSVGRPSCEIDPERLRQLRESKGWTQTEIALRLYTRLGKNHTSLAAQKTSYQRWEKHGKIDPKTARTLAEVLSVPLSILCGGEPEAPPSRMDEIRARLREQRAAGNKALISYLEDDQEASAAEDGLARRLAVELEYAQLSQDEGEFKRLSDLLGYSVSELQQPVGVNGHWMLVCEGHNLPIHPEIIHGTVDLLDKVEAYAQECLDYPWCDSRVTLIRESVWFRIRVFHPTDPEFVQSLSFVRCQASEKGLLWTKPTWVDDYFIQGLPGRLSQYANYVRGFDQQEMGPSNLANLKLAIYRLPTHQEVEEQGESALPTLVTLTNGCLDEGRDRLPFFLDEGSGHDLATNWICSDLMEVMKPLLCDWPLKYWKFASQGNAISVHLDAPVFLALERGRTDWWGQRFRIDLVEGSMDEELRRVPWRRKSVEKALERIQEHLKRELTEPGSGTGSDASPSIA